MSTRIGDIYRRTFHGDHVLITDVIPYKENVYQFKWYELENDVHGTYTNPFGDDLEDTGRKVFLRVA